MILCYRLLWKNTIWPSKNIKEHKKFQTKLFCTAFASLQQSSFCHLKYNYQKYITTQFYFIYVGDFEFKILIGSKKCT